MLVINTPSKGSSKYKCYEFMNEAVKKSYVEPVRAAHKKQHTDLPIMAQRNKIS